MSYRPIARLTFLVFRRRADADNWDIAGGEAGATKHNQIKRGTARAKKTGGKVPTISDFNKARLPHWQQNALTLNMEQASKKTQLGRGAAAEAADEGGAWATVGKDGKATMNSRQRRELRRAKLKLEQARAARDAAAAAASAQDDGGAGPSMARN